MGNYLNPDISTFARVVNSEIYVDKTGLIEYTNRSAKTLQSYICISRPRRFGKSIAANMLSAYYTCEYDSRELFSNFKIASSDSYEKHLNKYDVIFLNMQEFLSQSSNVEEMLGLLKKSVIWDLLDKYPDFRYFDETNLMRTLQDIYNKTKRPFVVIIDEWDCIFREYTTDKEAQEKYLDFLRDLLKDKGYVALAYMTGILPIKKYGSHSALNMFTEYSMTDPGELAEYFGFTETEVEILCKKYEMSFEEASAWYNGYQLISHEEGVRKVHSMYSPKSVVEAMQKRKFGTYWNQTETYEALKVYIQMNMDGLKDTIIEMLAGESARINTGTFSNDMTTFATKDDVLTLLVHLGYLTYDNEKETVEIPNREVSQEYVNAISTMDWTEVICMIPRKIHLDKPAVVIELKWDKSAEGAIEQIKNKEYIDALKDYQGDLLLAGINYDKKTKKHSCIVEKWNL